MQLGTVEADGAELEQFHFARQFQHLHLHLHKDAGQIVEEASTEAGQGVVIRAAAGSEVAKGERVVSGALDLAARKGTAGIAIAIDQQAEQQLGW